MRVVSRWCRCVVQRLCATDCKHPCLVRAAAPHSAPHSAPFPGKGVWGFGKDAEIERPKALQDAKPTKRSYRDKEFALLYKKADFFYKLSRLSGKERWLILEKFPFFARFVLTFSRQYSKIKIVCIID